MSTMPERLTALLNTMDLEFEEMHGAERRARIAKEMAERARLVEQAATQRLRVEVAVLREQRCTLAEIAAAIGLSVSRVQQLSGGKQDR